jgi:hypothetical protein
VQTNNDRIVSGKSNDALSMEFWKKYMTSADNVALYVANNREINLDALGAHCHEHFLVKSDK